MTTRVLSLALTVATAIFLSNTGAASSFPEPAEGWAYFFDGDSDAAAPPGAGFASLDGTWSHDNDADQWDGSGIGGDPGRANRPGGAMSITEGDLSFLRIQDTGDPRDYDDDFFDPGSNRNIFFIQELSPPNGVLFEDGFTLAFRARVPTPEPDGPPLDPLHPADGSEVEPYPETGDGFVTTTGGRGHFVVKEWFGAAIAFSLTTPGDTATAGGAPVEFAGLTMNSLNGMDLSPDVGFGQGLSDNAIALDPTEWHEFWIVIQARPTETSTHRVVVYRNGEPDPSVFQVTGGTGSDYGFSDYIGFGSPSSPQSAALDLDFLAYQFGAIFPEGAELPPDDGNGEPGPGQPVPITSASSVGNQIVFTFNAQAGRSYRVEYKNALDDPEWLPLQTFANAPAGPVEFAEPATQSHRFYRVMELSTTPPNGGPGPDPDQVLISPPARVGDEISFTFPTQAGRTYRIEYKNALTDTAWNLLRTVTAAADGTETVTDSTAVNPQRFYRIGVN